MWLSGVITVCTCDRYSDDLDGSVTALCANATVSDVVIHGNASTTDIDLEETQASTSRSNQPRICAICLLSLFIFLK